MQQQIDIYEGDRVSLASTDPKSLLLESGGALGRTIISCQDCSDGVKEVTIMVRDPEEGLTCGVFRFSLVALDDEEKDTICPLCHFLPFDEYPLVDLCLKVGSKGGAIVFGDRDGEHSSFMMMLPPSKVDVKID